MNETVPLTSPCASEASPPRFDALSVEAEIARLLPAYRDFLCRLVRVDSVRGRERPAQLMVKERLEGLGLAVSVHFSRDDDDAMNLAVRIPGRAPATHHSLVLNAHCDVAPVDAPATWARDPFSGAYADGMIHGRGAWDDKAGIAAIVMAAEVWRGLGIRAGGDLVLHAVVDEETSGAGTRTLVAAGWTGTGAVVCDGAWPERILVAHLGQVTVEVVVDGKAAAAASRHRGVDPIAIARSFIAALEAFVAERNAAARPFHTLERPYSVNVGAFHAGQWWGAIPADARLQIQVSFPDGDTAGSVLSRIEAIAAAVSDRIHVGVGTLVVDSFPGDGNARLVREVTSVAELVLGRKVVPVAVGGWTDMGHFGTAAVCLYGPGGGENGHGVDERYHFEHLGPCVRILIEVAWRWCNRLLPRSAGTTEPRREGDGAAAG